MRLRLTVRRHGLPETSIIWVVETTPSPTIAELLESVNESVPIEANQWGFEDYAVEVKGNGGKDYECLHYQEVAQVMKEDDEVIIRPLLTQDIKTRKRSGRHQISVEGYKLYDGLAYGKTLRRALANRPEIKIPPRKKRRITYHDEDDEDEEEDEQFRQGSVEALEDKPVSASGHSNKQLVLHADFDDDDEDDEDDDEDFAPPADEDEQDVDVASEPSEEDSDADDNPESEEERAIPDIHLDHTESPLSAEDQKTLDSVTDEPTRVKIRKLHSAFPTAAMAVCNFILIGTEGDMDGAYEAMVQGFAAVKPKSAITEITAEPKKASSSKTRSKSGKRSIVEPESEDLVLESLSIPKTRSKAKKSLPASFEPASLPKSKTLSEPQASSKRKKSSQPEPEPQMVDNDEQGDDDDDEDDDDEEDEIESKAKYYDQNGFPPGSIKGGVLTTFGPDMTINSPSRPVSRRSNSVVSNKSVRFAIDESLSKDLTSTPFIDQEEHDDDEESDVTSSDSSDDTSEESIEAEDVTSSSEDSDSSDSDSSDSESPQIIATPNLTLSTVESDSDSSSSSSSDNDPPEETSSKPSGEPGNGLGRTQSRNERRRNALRLKRYMEKGILPGDTTTKEFRELNNIKLETPPEEALAALNKLRTSHPPLKQDVQQLTGRALAKADEFERRRNELLSSLAAGGIEVGLMSSKPGTAKSQEELVIESFVEQVSIMTESQQEGNGNSTGSEIAMEKSQIDSSGSLAPSEKQCLFPAPETSPTESPVAPSQPPPSPAESSQSASVRRAKLDVGAGRRLLFGALGIKTPKTKKDEEKIRSNLMKDVRPTRTPKEAETPVVDSSADVTEESPDSWRETINYRAVECVQEGIELSEPPFPFVQRWDPQQQNPWKGNKRKKDQGDQSDYVDDNRASKKQKQRKGKHNYHEEQEYLDESYQPSYQEDSFVTNYDDPSQLSVARSEDVEDEISQQLMNEIQPSIKEATQDPEDLAPLPENPTLLPDLENGKIQVGMVIAYKTLECSAETRWQPQLSGYLTAIVIDIEENGQLHLTLAKRDRRMNTYDETTGERVYTQFEMAADDDEDEEDDGSVYLMFNEMREAKIVQEPPADLNDDIVMDETSNVKNLSSLTNSVTLSNKEGTQEEQQVESQEQDHETSQAEAQEAHLSHVTETPFQSDAPEPEHVQDDVVESPSQSDATSPKRVLNDSKSPAPSDAPSPDHHEDDTTESPAPSDSGPGQLEDSEVFHEAQQDEDITETPASFDEVSEHPDDAEVFHEAQVEPEIEDDENSESLNPTPKASAIRPSTPSMQFEEAEVDADILPNAVSDENRREISHLIKDAGFRSSISSTIMRDIRPNGMETPGDAAVFEKLTNEMQPRSAQASSPKFGFGTSSPVRARALSPHHFECQREPGVSLAHLQSSWVTVDEPISSQPDSPLPKVPEQQDSQDWETDSEAQPSSPPVSRPAKPESIKKQPRKRVPIANAQARWEELAGTRSKTNSPAETSKPVPELKQVSEDEDEDDTNLYPKLSTQSSFNSQFADYGRQPDFDSADSAPFATFGDEVDPTNHVVDSSAHNTEEGRRSRRDFIVKNSREETAGLEPASKALRLPSKSPISARIEELLNSPPKRVSRRSHIPEVTPSPDQAVPLKKIVEKAPTPKEASAVEEAIVPEKRHTPESAPVLEESITVERSPIPEEALTVMPEKTSKTASTPKRSPSSGSAKEPAPEKVLPIMQTSHSEAPVAVPKRTPTPESIIPKPAEKDEPWNLDSDDDEFPDIDVILSQPQRAPKVERMTSADSAQAKKKPVQKKGSFGLDGALDEPDSPEPQRASQPRLPHSRASENASIKSRNSYPSASQHRQYESRTIKTRDSQSPASQSRVGSSIPTGSQFIDLSLSSSDVEPDEPAPKPVAADESDDEPPSFNRYDLDDDNDQNWGVKKGAVGGGGKKKRRSENELRNSSQTSLNKRKASSKY